MDFRVDAKGKVFTAHVTKNQMAITAGVGDLVIRGILHIKPDARLKDEMNDSEPFIAITNARVTTKTGILPVYETDALIVNKSQLAWIFEDPSPQEK